MTASTTLTPHRGDPARSPGSHRGVRSCLGPEEAIPDELGELSMAELQVLHSRICRQLDREYLTTPQGPHPCTTDRLHDVLGELDARDNADLATSFGQHPVMGFCTDPLIVRRGRDAVGDRLLDRGRVAGPGRGRGIAVLGGFYVAFSLLVMPALRRCPAGEASATMIAVDQAAVRAPSLVLFFGTALARPVHARLWARANHLRRRSPYWKPSDCSSHSPDQPGTRHRP